MCEECEKLRELMVRAFGHMLKSEDPATRRTAEQVRETLRREKSLGDRKGQRV